MDCSVLTSLPHVSSSHLLAGRSYVARKRREWGDVSIMKSTSCLYVWAWFLIWPISTPDLSLLFSIKSQFLMHSSPDCFACFSGNSSLAAQCLTLELLLLPVLYSNDSVLCLDGQCQLQWLCHSNVQSLLTSPSLPPSACLPQCFHCSTSSTNITINLIPNVSLCVHVCSWGPIRKNTLHTVYIWLNVSDDKCLNAFSLSFHRRSSLRNRNTQTRSSNTDGTKHTEVEKKS